MTKARLEAFSDGVFAIAITLLVLDLRVPQGLAEGGLWAALRAAWPSYCAYLTSFLVIGIMWVNHHGVFERARAVDRPVLFANLALLLLVSVLPFPTRLVAEFLTRGDDGKAALAVYSVVMVLVGWAYSALWLVLTRETEGEGLLLAHLDRAAHRAAIRRFGLGSVAYLTTVGLSFVTPVGTLAVHAALAVYYCFDQLRAAPAVAPAGPPGSPGSGNAPRPIA
jgi:uncharacterized membrane protein